MDRDALIQQIVSRGRNDKGAIRPEAVFQLLAIDGVKVPQIANAFGVSRNAIYKIVKAGEREDLLPQRLRTELMRLSPWKDVETQHWNMAQRQYVAHHIEYMLTNGKGMDEYKISRLRYFWGLLGDPMEVVLTYDRNEPRNQWSSSGGWKYVPREDSDGERIIRTEDELSAEQERIFVRPENWKSI
ncbi:hypothetical protein ACFC1L_39875 [Streptomyces sp. NPDC056210]|uniref:hypothetical protein n=1 Tax=Streptomyces sp. NPDC056210 TaxID=3345746 RepID=UPI0035DC9209